MGSAPVATPMRTRSPSNRCTTLHGATLHGRTLPGIEGVEMSAGITASPRDTGASLGPGLLRCGRVELLPMAERMEKTARKAQERMAWRGVCVCVCATS